MNWTKAERYRSLRDVSALEMEVLRTKTAASPWRFGYHIQPPTGLLNDPNGFAYYDGEYHLFYQWFPLGPVHGLKHWYHVSSTDLVNWTDRGVALVPETMEDSHGAYSGSGFVVDDTLHVMYTGNHRTDDWTRHASQIIGVLRDGVIERRNVAIPSVPAGYTEHFRDPKVWEEDGLYYAIVGAQRTDETGCVVLYRSTDLNEWTFLGEVKTELERFGYMWECPDVFELNGKHVLIFSPQGIEPDGHRYHNIYQSGYVTGTLDLETLVFTHESFEELDFGFDFYAPQTTEHDGRRILVGWMGLPEIEYPTDRYGWAHALTLPRELSLEDGVLKQRPVPEMKQLQTNQFADESGTHIEMISPERYELKLSTSGEDFELELLKTEEESLVIRYEKDTRELTIDRTNAGEPFATEFGTTRTKVIEVTSLHLFVDSSSVECFVNDGDAVATLRVFPSDDEKRIRYVGADATLVGWKYE
ncbi:sucrose-6-phosphate hydrolase [Exiguobacterium sp. s189]|uniref:glycoside hydrolase family 32 protein n=1 Tax=Exiguobacterium sp. s189 TaxID=2751263 RepID=UPI001BEC2674|nr:sucrose-6-phosphate hydrolase [Exiguobacterium sp. s189]